MGEGGERWTGQRWEGRRQRKGDGGWATPPGTLGQKRNGRSLFLVVLIFSAPGEARQMLR